MYSLSLSLFFVFQFFNNVIGVSIPESRFVPLDATSDLLLLQVATKSICTLCYWKIYFALHDWLPLTNYVSLQSDIYTSREGVLARNPARIDALNPVIDLGPEYEKVKIFLFLVLPMPCFYSLSNELYICSILRLLTFKVDSNPFQVLWGWIVWLWEATCGLGLILLWRYDICFFFC